MKADIERKRKREQYVVDEMIHLYCRKQIFCSNCRVHCYQPEMREKIRQVMRYSGPGIILSHPILALWHVLSSMKEKRKQKEERKP